MTATARRIRTAALTAGALAALAGTPGSLGQTYNWTNGGGTNVWTQGSNWDPEGPPSAGAVAVIGSGFPRVDCYGATPVVLSTLNSQSPLRVTVNQFTVGEAICDGLILGPATCSAGSLLLPGTNSWISGSVTAGSFVVPGGATLNLTGGGSWGVPTLDACTLTNDGQVTMITRMVLRDGARIENRGTWNIDGGSGFTTLGTTPGRFVNTGAVHGNYGAATMQIPVDNQAGRINSTTFLTLNGGGLHTAGTFAADAGATTRLYNADGVEHTIAGPVTFEGQGISHITGGGLFQIESGAHLTANVAAPGHFRLDLFNGITDATGGITNRGVMRWTGGRIQSDQPAPAVALLNDDGASLSLEVTARLAGGLTNRGTARQTGTLYLENGHVINNAALGRWELVSGHFTSDHDQTGLFENRGTLVKPPGNGADFSLINIPSVHFGGSTIHVEFSTLHFNTISAPALHAVRGPVTMQIDPDAAIQVSNSTMDVEGGANLGINGGGAFTLNSTATMQIGGGGFVVNRLNDPDELGFIFSGGRIVGAGRFVNEAGAYFRMGGGEITLSDSIGFLNLGTVNITSGARTLGGRFTNNETVIQAGTLTVLSGGSIANTKLWDLRAGSIGGASPGPFYNSSSQSVLVKTGGGGATVSSPFTNAGAARAEGGNLTFAGPVVNNKTMEAAGVGASLTLAGPVQNSDRISAQTGALSITGNTANAGTISAAFGATASISGTLDNTGTVHALEGGTISIPGPIVQITGTTLTGGTWIVDAGGTLTTPGRTITSIGAGASVRIGSGAWPEFQAGETSGRLTVPRNQRRDVQGPFRVRGGGSTSIESNATLNVGGDLVVESILGEIDEVLVPNLAPPPPGPRGYVASNVNNGGQASPGSRGLAGPLHIAGNYNQFAAGTLNIDLAGLLPIDEHDQAIITGAASLAGTLDITIPPAFTPEPGQQFTILTAAQVTGDFDAVQIAGLPADLAIDVVYTPAAVTLAVVRRCRADLDNSGSLTLADFITFRNLYTAGDMRADFDASGALTLNDFVQFRNAYTAGCP